MLDSVIKYVIAWFMACVNHLIDLVFVCADSLMVPLANALPDLRTGTSFLVGIIGLANQFIALDFAVVLFVAYIVFALSISLVNWILGLIPTIN